MRIFGRDWGHVPHHAPRVRCEGPLTWENLYAVFDGCADFARRELELKDGSMVRLCWLDGMVRQERLNDYIVRPLAAWPLPEGQSVTRSVLDGGVWNQNAQRQEELNRVVYLLLEGHCALFLPDGVITCWVATEEKRAITAPENESEVKGAKESFVESVRTNTSLLRRRMRSPDLRVERCRIGRRTRTPVEMVWLEGIAGDALPRAVRRRLEQIDEDALLTTAELEEYLTDPRASAFPRVLFTERPDRFCQGLLEGRVGLLVDGIPLGCLLPGNIGLFLTATQDWSFHWAVSSLLVALRYLCMMITLVTPGFYIAVAQYHFELIPTRLAMSIIASKQDVPFSTAFEVLGLLVAFEILQEAGIRLPRTIGQTVSIIGGLVVGQAAVDAKIVSPVVVIVVAVSGIAGFTMPNQDFANALRLWRLILAVLGAVAGIFGLTVGAAFLIAHLASLEDFGVAYLAPFAMRDGADLKGGALWREPVPEDKLRPLELRPKDRRRRW